MSNWTISGIWIGRYSYDPQVAETAPVEFTFDARPEGWLGRFRGTIRDNPAGGGIPEPAAMAGRVCGNGVRFRKRYPDCYVHCDGRSMTLAEAMLMQNGIRLDEPPPPSPIWYRGTYDPHQEIVKGTWIIKGHWIRIKFDGQVRDTWINSTTGSWMMWREGH